MSHINKLLIIFVNLALAIGCSSNITKDVYKENLTISIEKPKITYSIDRLPKEINLYVEPMSSDCGTAMGAAYNT